MGGIFDPEKFVKGSDSYVDHSLDVVNDEVVEKPKRTRKKSSNNESDTTALVTTGPTEVANSMQYCQTNEPYINAYVETNQQLNTLMEQLDSLGNATAAELMKVQQSKTLKNKFGYMNDMTMNLTSILNSKLNVIKEKNKTINDVNNMELKRLKDLKVSQNEQDDNVKIMNMYDAFVNTPIGSLGAGMSPMSVLGPSPQDLALGVGNTEDLNRIQMGNVEASQLSPEKNRMVLEAQGRIDTVVYFDKSTGNRWFEVVDKSTGQPMTGVEKPDETFIYDFDINERGGFAKDPLRNTSYPLVVLNNSDDSILNY